MTIRMRAFGSTGSSSFTLVAEPDSPGSSGEQRVSRELCFERDIDGSWLVWAVDPRFGDPRPPADGAIAVRDSTVGGFLEALGQLLADPSRFEHEPRFDGVLRWMSVLAPLGAERSPPTMSLLDDLSNGLLQQQRTGMVFHDP